MIKVVTKEDLKDIKKFIESKIQGEMLTTTHDWMYWAPPMAEDEDIEKNNYENLNFKKYPKTKHRNVRLSIEDDGIAFSSTENNLGEYINNTYQYIEVGDIVIYGKNHVDIVHEFDETNTIVWRIKFK